MQVLLTGAHKYSDTQLQAIEALGYTYTMHEDERQVVDEAQKFDAVVCNGLFLYNNVKAFSNLKLIQATSAGLERLPLAYAAENGIEVRNARGVYSVPMAEWAVMSALNLLRNSRQAFRQQDKAVWEKDRNQRELNGLTVTIVGVGSVGQECAKRFKAFNTRVIGVDISDIDCNDIDAVEDIEALDIVLPTTDVLVLTCPLTDSTQGLISAQRIGLLKSGSIIINISRGGVVDERALAEALHKRRIYGAALDVFEEEPLRKDSPLWQLGNVIVTPHSSFVSDKNDARMFKRIQDSLVWLKEQYNG